jgi:hypothetical protein
VLEIEDVTSCGCSRFFKAEGALENVPGHCELAMLKFLMQRALQENPFGDRKANLSMRVMAWLALSCTKAATYSGEPMGVPIVTPP